MSNEAIEQKLAELAQRVAILEAQAKEKPVAKKSWMETVGAIKDTDLFDEAMKLGAEWRAKANAEER